MKGEIKTGNLSPEIAKSILEAHSSKLLEIPEELKNDLYGTELFELDDGRVAIISVAGGGYLYKSLTEFLEVFKHDSDESVNKVMYPFNSTFPNSINELSEDLFNHLAIPIKFLNFSIESLEVVDNKLQPYIKSDFDFIKSKLYSGIVAYVYEVLRRAVNGRIEMRTLPRFDDILYPIVIDANGKEYNLILLIQDQLQTSDNLLPLSSAVIAELPA